MFLSDRSQSRIRRRFCNYTTADASRKSQLHTYAKPERCLSCRPLLLFLYLGLHKKVESQVCSRWIISLLFLQSPNPLHSQFQAPRSSATSKMSATSQKYQFYKYHPSTVIAAITTALFGLLSAFHLFKLLQRRTWYFIPFFCGCLCECSSGGLLCPTC